MNLNNPLDLEEVRRGIEEGLQELNEDLEIKITPIKVIEEPSKNDKG